MILRIQPDEGIDLKFAAKVPGTGVHLREVEMDFLYGTSFASPSPDAYETLLLDCMLGDSSLFTRSDEVEAAWALFTEILEGWRKHDPAVPQLRGGKLGAEMRPTISSSETCANGASFELLGIAMVVEDGLVRLARWDESPTTADAIANALAKIWRGAGAPRGGDHDGREEARSGVLRARVANLVAFAESAEQAERAEAVIQELSTQNPVRSVPVLADKSVPDGQLSAALQIYCRPMRNRQLCFEQIRITAGAGQVPHFPEL